MPRKRKRGGASRSGGRARVVERLIQMKVTCNFSARQLKEIIKFKSPQEAELVEKIVRKELRQNYSALRLHGCSVCEDFIWIAGENIACDNCNNQEGRFVPSSNLPFVSGAAAMFSCVCFLIFFFVV